MTDETTLSERVAKLKCGSNMTGARLYAAWKNALACKKNRK